MRWEPFLTGVAVWIAALAVLVSFPDLPAESEDSIEVVVDAVVSEDAVEVFEEVVEPIVPNVAGLDAGVSEVLADTGYAQFTSSSELSKLLPDVIVDVLIEHDAVLVVREEPEDE